MNSTIRVSLAAAVVASLAISTFAALAEKYADFGKGPVQFLMTRDEAAKWKTIRDDAEAQSFIDLFWARRDPTPGTPQNEFHDAFDARVKAADEQFTHGKVRGALTDRGKVLIVMGGPTSIAKPAGPPTTSSIATPTSGTNPGLNPEAVQGYSPKQVWYYDKGKTNLPLEQPKVEVAFIDQYSGNDWKIERTGRVDYTTLFDRVAQSYVTQPNLTSAPAPQPAAVPVAVAAPAAPDASLHTEAYKSAVAEAKAGKGALAKNARIASAEFVSPAGDYFVPVQIYVDKASGLTAESADTIFGVISDASGTVVTSFEEPVKPMLSKGDLLADRSLSLPSGKYTAVVGIGKGGQPVAIASAPLELTSIAKDATGMSGLILTNDVQEMAEAAPVKAPFAFGKLKIVPKTSIGNKDDLNYFVELHNPGIDASTNLPKLQVKLELSGGKLAQPITAPLTDAPALPLSGAPGPGQYALISAIPLGQLKTPLAPGDYKLRVKVVDTVSKQTFNVEQTFKVTG
jgi:GWxTD domain-containing protein